MRLYVRLFLICAVITSVAFLLNEQPQKATAKQRLDNAQEALCAGTVKATEQAHRPAAALGPKVFAAPETESRLPWEAIFDARPAGLRPALSLTLPTLNPSAPKIFGLPSDDAGDPHRSLLAPAQIVDVSVNSNFFSPQTVRITAGDTVRWTWIGSGHTVTSGFCCNADDNFCSPSDMDCASSPLSFAGTVYSHKFDSPGTFSYFCQMHLSLMTGRVIVDPAGAGATLQFSATNYDVTEGCATAIVTVTRSGDTSGTTTVDFGSSDSSALQRTDYATASGALTFAPGETSKTFNVLVTQDAYVEGNETLNAALSNPTGGALGSPNTATVTIIDNDTVTPPVTQPIDDAATFVCQHYHDFLSREPDSGGAAFWTGQITQCGIDFVCIRGKRVDVSNAFFYELEFQQTGSYVYRLYREAFGNNQPFPNPDNSNQIESKKLPSYTVFARDRARVVGGSNLAQGQLDLANVFVGRPEFLAKYPASQDGPTFVDAVLATIKNEIGVDLASQRTALISLFNSGGRGAVMYRLADDNTQTNPINNRAFIDAEYNRAFVATQYFGYLRRDSDIGGFLFWLGQVNSGPLRDGTKQHGMVCSFITSQEYQERFSSVVTHSNSECQQ